MTVIVSKPAVNLREELASLRNQGGYQEEQFYFDGLVTNGTFDADTSGWTASAGFTLAQNAGALDVSYDGVSGLYYVGGYQVITTVVGKTYVVSADVTAVDPSSDARFRIEDSLGGGQHLSTNIGVGSYTWTFTASSTTTYINLALQANVSGTVSFDNISVYETDGTDAVHRMPKGWVPKDFYEDGLLQREGSAHDYEVVYDGFDYYVKPTVAPSATTQTCVMGVKA